MLMNHNQQLSISVHYINNNNFIYITSHKREQSREMTQIELQTSSPSNNMLNKTARQEWTTA